MPLISKSPTITPFKIDLGGGPQGLGFEMSSRLLQIALQKIR